MKLFNAADIGLLTLGILAIIILAAIYIVFGGAVWKHTAELEEILMCMYTGQI